MITSHILKPTTFKMVHHLIDLGNLELFRASFEIVLPLVSLPIVSVFPVKCAILSRTPSTSEIYGSSGYPLQTCVSFRLSLVHGGDYMLILESTHQSIDRRKFPWYIDRPIFIFISNVLELQGQYHPIVERPWLEGTFWIRNNFICDMKLQKKASIWGSYKRPLQLEEEVRKTVEMKKGEQLHHVTTKLTIAS